MRSEHRDVIVVGGGISGLTAAWHLKKAGLDVCVLEGEPGVGGCTRTEHRDGFLLEKGPFNVIVRDPAFERLLEDLADQVKVIPAGPAARARYVYRGGRLHAVPTNPVALVRTKLLSTAAKCRLLAGLCVSHRPGSDEETIEQAATRRFGPEVSRTLISAVISGIYAGDSSRLSLKACFPGVWRIDTKMRSPLGYGLKTVLARLVCGTGLKPVKPSGDMPGVRASRRWRGLISIEGGLGRLTAALGEQLGTGLHTRCEVDSIRTADRGYTLTCKESDDAVRQFSCHHLFLASSVRAAARLLTPLSSEASTILRSIESASLVVLNIGFRREDVGHPMKGYGFLVPANEPDFPLMGVLWADSIFPHHAPPDRRLIRVFLGGSRDHLGGTGLKPVIQRTDDELIAQAMDALGNLLDLSGRPVLVDVCRYPAAIPQYLLGHNEKISRLGETLSNHPNLHLIGNYLHGVSINDCVRLAAQAADKLTPVSRKGPELGDPKKTPVRGLKGDLRTGALASF